MSDLVLLSLHTCIAIARVCPIWAVSLPVLYAVTIHTRHLLHFV